MEIDKAKEMIRKGISLKEIKKATKVTVAILNQFKKEIKIEESGMEIIRELYMKGYSINRIAQNTGIKVDNINYYVYFQHKLHKQFPRQMGRPPLNSEKREKKAEVLEQFPKDTIERVIKLTNFGYPPQEIAEDQDISTAKVRAIIMQAQQMNRIRKII